MDGFSFSFEWSYVPMVLAALVLLAAGIKDVRSYKISNWLSIALALLFPIYALIAHVPFWPHLMVGLIAFAVGFGLYALGGCGGGDVKLMAAAALWAGPHFIVTLILATALFGGALAMVYGVAQLMKRMKKTQSQSDGLADKTVMPWHKAPVPYGVAIACGGWMVLFLMARGPLT